MIGKSSLAPSIKENGGSLVVPVFTLDNIINRLNLDRVDFVKINAEGAALEVLQGMSQGIKRFFPDFAITTDHYPNESTLISNHLKRKGYSVIENKNILYAVMKHD